MAGSMDNQRVKVVDASQAQLFLMVGEDGMVQSSGRVSKRRAALVLNHIAQIWEAEGIAKGEPEPEPIDWHAPSGDDR